MFMDSSSRRNRHIITTRGPSIMPTPPRPGICRIQLCRRTPTPHRLRSQQDRSRSRPSPPSPQGSQVSARSALTLTPGLVSSGRALSRPTRRLKSRNRDNNRTYTSNPFTGTTQPSPPRPIHPTPSTSRASRRSTRTSPLRPSCRSSRRGTSLS